MSFHSVISYYPALIREGVSDRKGVSLDHPRTRDAIYAERTRVLFVNDVDYYRERMIKIFKARNLDTVGVSCREDLLAALATFKADVILLDTQAPNAEDIYCIQQIKKRHPLCEIIVLTAHADMDLSIRILESGAFAYLLKPINMDCLIARLSDARDNKILHTPPTDPEGPKPAFTIRFKNKLLDFLGITSGLRPVLKHPQ
ncbi:MAG: response regulator [Deltaproteobacteria bacterium]|nr:response regulator [Deltaproteobacteria bacterium]